MRGGFIPSQAAYVYLLTTSENYYKIGITSRSPELRLRDIHSSSELDFMIVKSWFFESGKDAFNIEAKLLDHFSSHLNKIPEKFNGSTECFISECLNEVLIDAEQIVSDYMHTLIVNK